MKLKEAITLDTARTRACEHLDAFELIFDICFDGNNMSLTPAAKAEISKLMRQMRPVLMDRRSYRDCQNPLKLVASSQAADIPEPMALMPQVARPLRAVRG